MMTESKEMLSEPMDYIFKIGSKGELFPPKEIRDRLGLKPDQIVVASVIGNKMIVRKIVSPLETLKEPPRGKISVQALQQLRRTLNSAIDEL
jgi:bifunctional DNA-binding transcriptional regulator/antitoxin component of YhaV-PrlF toxin-antitoxin module